MTLHLRQWQASKEGSRYRFRHHWLSSFHLKVTNAVDGRNRKEHIDIWASGAADGPVEHVPEVRAYGCYGVGNFEFDLHETKRAGVDGCWCHVSTIPNSVSQYQLMRIIPDPEEVPTMPLWPDVGRDVLHMSRSASYAAVARGDIPTIRIGGAIRVPTAALRRLLQLDDAAKGVSDDAA
jgi:hypothetical protein